MLHRNAPFPPERKLFPVKLWATLIGAAFFFVTLPTVGAVVANLADQNYRDAEICTSFAATNQPRIKFCHSTNRTYRFWILARKLIAGDEMYRCHFTYNGRIVAGDDLVAHDLDDAVQEAEVRLSIRAQAAEIDGFEIWRGSELLHAFTDPSAAPRPAA